MSDKSFDSEPKENLRHFAEVSIAPAPAFWDKLEAQLDWDDEVRATLSSASQTPPPAVWAAIEEALGEEDEKPAILLWWRWAAAVLLLALLGVVTFYWRNTQTNEEELQVEQPQQRKQDTSETLQQKEKDKASSTPSQKEKLYTSDEFETKDNQRFTDISSDKQTTIQPQLNPITTTTDAVGSSIVVPSKKIITANTREEATLVELERIPMVFAPKTLILPLQLQGRTSLESKKQTAVITLTPKWFVNVHGGGGQFLPNYSGTFAAGSISVLGADGDNLREVLTGSLRGTSRTFGLEVGRSLGKRWVLVSGLNYIRTNYSTQIAFYKDVSTPLASDPFTRQFFSTELTQQQEWLSVPLYLGYQVGKGRLNALIMSGLSTDVLLSETLQNDGFTNDFVYSLGETNRTSFNFLLGTQLQYAILPSRRLKVILDGRYESAFGSNLNTPDATQIPERYQAQFGLRWDF